eukprot:881432-Pelagomonas_calceolata.AAC.4
MEMGAVVGLKTVRDLQRGNQMHINAPRHPSSPCEHHHLDTEIQQSFLHREYSGQRKLPPPIDGRTFFQELPGYLQQSRHLGSQLNAGTGPGGLARGETPVDGACPCQNLSRGQAVCS